MMIWANRTELEKGLILILIFLIPLLIFLIGLYIHFSIRKSNVEKYPWKAREADLENNITTTEKHPSKLRVADLNKNINTTEKYPAKFRAADLNKYITTTENYPSTLRFADLYKYFTTTENYPSTLRFEDLYKYITTAEKHPSTFRVAVLNKNITTTEKTPVVHEDVTTETSKYDISKLVKRSVPIQYPKAHNDCYNIFEPHQFISSISETIFEDDPTEFKLKCSAVVLTENYILTFPNCLSKNLTLKVRSSSEYWSKNGHISRISIFVTMNNLLVIGKLTTPLSNHGIKVKLVKISNSNDLKSITQFDSFRWNSKFTSGLNRRKKYEKLNKIRLNISECTNNDKHFDGFCALETRKLISSEDLDDRDPIFQIDSNKLIGMEVKRIIWKDQIEHYYLYIKNSDIDKYLIDKINLF